MDKMSFLLPVELENILAALWNPLCTVGPLLPTQTSLLLCDLGQVA